MRQIRTFSDIRLEGHCIYCLKDADSREHVPSKVFLDKPFPENLPIVPACSKCNQDFSLDEEYVACLLECTLSGTTDPEHLERLKIGKILNRKPKLRRMLQDAREEIGGKVHFSIDRERVERIIVKLAKGHAKYENSEIQLNKPIYVGFSPISFLSESERNSFLLMKKFNFFQK